MLNNYCPECKVLVSEKFCWSCGRKSVGGIVKCLHCGEEVTILGKFCGNCGKPIQEAVQEHIKIERERRREEVKPIQEAIKAHLESEREGGEQK